MRRKILLNFSLSYCEMHLAAVWIVSMQLMAFLSHYFTTTCHQRISLFGFDFTATTLCKLYSAERGVREGGEGRQREENLEIFGGRGVEER